MITLPPLRISDEVAALIRTLHPVLKKRGHAALHEIRTKPDSGKKLQDELDGYRSFRVGKFRIIYRRTARKDIEIVAVGPRRSIYEETVRLIAKQEGL
jgi:mRNA interferase RelE/StbE